MDSVPDNEFSQLEKLLRLKRHEVPPPRYFNDFSSKVLERIQSGEARASWWDRFGFDLRPALAAATGVLACGLVIYGVAVAGNTDKKRGESRLTQLPPAANAVAGNTAEANSTNPVPTYGTPIDRNVFRPQTVPVGFNSP